MPIYEYKCALCGHQQEALQKVSDALLTRCANCGKESLAKMVTAAGFQLKGSGWYATDFRSGGTAPAAKTDAKGDTKSDAKSDSKSDSKADSGTESKAQPASGGAKTEGAKESTAPSGGTSASPASR